MDFLNQFDFRYLSRTLNFSFSSKNFLKKLTSLASENPEKTEKFANYLKNEMERKKEVSYLIKVDKEIQIIFYSYLLP